MPSRVTKPAAVDPNGGFTLTQLLSAIAPVSTIIKYAGDTTDPNGWMLCDGRQLATASYPALFAIIGYTYGGAGANFNIPDLRGEFIRILNATGIGDDAGRVMGSNQAGTLQNHSHGTLNGGISSGGSHYHGFSVSLNTSGSTHRHNLNYCADDQASNGSTPLTSGPNGHDDSDSFGGGSHSHNYSVSAGGGGGHGHGGSASVSSVGTETRPRNIAISLIIKVY